MIRRNAETDPEGKINLEPLITHTYPLSRIEEAYELFENKRNA